MQPPWRFETDAKLDAFCQGIVAEMVARFGTPEAEAIGRVNRHWGGQDFLRSEYGWMIYHETEEEWAHIVYLGEGSYWWIAGDKREQLGLGAVTPKPYP